MNVFIQTGCADQDGGTLLCKLRAGRIWLLFFHLGLCSPLLPFKWQDPENTTDTATPTILLLMVWAHVTSVDGNRFSNTSDTRGCWIFKCDLPDNCISPSPINWSPSLLGSRTAAADRTSRVLWSRSRTSCQPTRQPTCRVCVTWRRK